MSQEAVQSAVQTEESPSFELDANYLTIRARSEQEFLAGYEEFFWGLMHSEEPDVTIDLSRCEGVGDDVFRMIALNMFEVGSKRKQITIRIPEELERLFKHANLYRVAEIEVVHLLGRARKKQVGLIGDGEPSGEASREQSREASREAPRPAGSQSEEHQPVDFADKPDDEGSRPGEKKRELETALRERFEAKRAADEQTAKLTSSAGGATGTGTGRLVDRRTGQIVELAQNPTNIGRVPGNDILIAMPLVSKRHSTITIDDDGRYFIEDLKSSNGTFVNGERLMGRQPLHDGSRIQIAITSQYPNGAKEYTFRQG